MTISTEQLDKRFRFLFETGNHNELRREMDEYLTKKETELDITLTKEERRYILDRSMAYVDDETESVSCLLDDELTNAEDTFQNERAENP